MRLEAPVVLLLVAETLVRPTNTRAQDACVPRSPEPLEVQLTPAVGAAGGVTLDSPVIARYAADVDVFDFAPEDLLTLDRLGDDGSSMPVAGRYERFDAQPNVLVFRPAGPLASETSFGGTVFDPIERDERSLAFVTGDRVDEVEPRFPASGAVSLRAAGRGSGCQGTRVDVSFTPALDDGPRGSVEHLVLQTRGAGLTAPVLRSRVRASMGGEVTASFLLDADQAAEPLCVVVLAVDGVGRVGDPAGPACFTPDGEARFVGLCAMSHFRGGSGPGAPALLGVALCLCLRRLRAHGRA